MSVEFIGQSAAHSEATTALFVEVPADVLAGDLLLAAIATTSSIFSPPVGWRQHQGVPMDHNGGADPFFAYLFSRVAEEGDAGSSILWLFNGALQHQGSMIAYRSTFVGVVSPDDHGPLLKEINVQAIIDAIGTISLAFNGFQVDADTRIVYLNMRRTVGVFGAVAPLAGTTERQDLQEPASGFASFLAEENVILPADIEGGNSIFEVPDDTGPESYVGFAVGISDGPSGHGGGQGRGHGKGKIEKRIGRAGMFRRDFWEEMRR